MSAMPLPVPLVLALTSDPAPTDRAVAPAIGITALAAGVAIGLRAGQHDHITKHLARCRWCDPPALDEATRAALHWQSPPGSATPRRKLANTLSNVTFASTYVWSIGSLIGASAFDHRATARNTSIDVLLVAEPVAISAALNQIVKLEVGRQRPDVHHGVVAPGNDEDNLSFYSGHTALTFTSAVAAGTVASLRGYRGSPAVWAGGLFFASATGYLRIAADRHWLTDVLVGAAAGAAIGTLVPRLHLAAASTTTLPSAPGASPTWITWSGTF
ncbi:phosphoesterase PA-phosphatase related protein [Minicystis rosea]|nr:phosphoesterase PA-phosphatase related protein [Minicystis rosea]